MTWILFTAGRGPVECEVAVAKIASRFTDLAVADGYQCRVLEHTDGKYGLLSCLIAIEGDNPDHYVLDWHGTIEWKWASTLRQTRRKNWFIGAKVIVEPDQAFGLKQTDLKFETFRASGPGGQHVNTTDSAVRVTHIPSGNVAQAQEERSQHRNKALALARLTGIMLEIENEKVRQVEQTKWSSHNTVERGKPVKIFVGENCVLQKTKHTMKELH